MKLPTLLGICLAVTACAQVQTNSTLSADAASALAYPVSKRVEQVDHYPAVDGSQIAVADPYRWLEELDSSDTRDWIAAQNQTTNAYLTRIADRNAIHTRLSTLWNFERFGVPVKHGGRYFYTRNNGLQNQAVLYVTEALDQSPAVLLDPNQLSEDGTVALSGAEVSEDGRWLAYGTSSGGSDWQQWRVREVASGVDTGDQVDWVKFSSASWAKDGSGFYYSRYDQPEDGDPLKAVNEQHKVYFHRLGTAQSEDRLIYSRPDEPQWGFNAQVTEDGRYLLITSFQGTDERNRIFYQRLDTADAPVETLVGELTAAFNFIDNDGDVFYFLTDLDAPRYRVVATDISRPGNWSTLVAEGDATLVGASAIGDKLVLEYLRDAHSELRITDRGGRIERDVQLPGLGSVSGLEGSRQSSETFYSFTGFTTPPSVYRLDVESGLSTLYQNPSTPLDESRFETRQVFYPSKDGTQIPIFITARKGITLDGTAPTLLYGYGGFNIPVTPSYKVPIAVWLDMGGVYAVANLRGGGEYGGEWHEAGMKLNKQNVFDDFAAAAEYLIAENWTRPSRLAILGGSNGGLLAAATAQQRPELFAATVPIVGVLDMLRFNQFTIGWAWESDYGSPQDPVEFAALRAYSPLHNLQSGVNYPATLIVTGDHDDRVFPAHSFKYAAALQATYQGERPMLIRVETRGGHGAGKPTAKQINEWTDILGFLKAQLEF
ncbi:MAG: S9 family peptidase [Xanthomonadales bacterium]|nr:S9 family peptidase [Xanthomonadales bacterium]